MFFFVVLLFLSFSLLCTLWLICQVFITFFFTSGFLVSIHFSLLVSFFLTLLFSFVFFFSFLIVASQAFPFQSLSLPWPPLLSLPVAAFFLRPCSRCLAVPVSSFPSSDVSISLLQLQLSRALLPKCKLFKPTMLHFLSTLLMISISSTCF